MKKSIFVILLLSACMAMAQASLGQAAIYDNLDEQHWKTCGTCGNDHGNNGKAVYDVQAESQFSRDGVAALFSIDGRGNAYANGYFYQQHAATPAANFEYQFDLFVPSDYASTPQAIEFEVEQHIAGWVYNWAWQAEWGAKRWRVFNYEAGHWEPTGIPLNLSPGSWHHIKAIDRRNADNTGTHVALIVDGVIYPVNLKHNRVLRYSRNSNGLNNGFQLDTNAKGQPYSVLVDGMILKAY